MSPSSSDARLAYLTALEKQFLTALEQSMKQTPPGLSNGELRAEFAISRDEVLATAERLAKAGLTVRSNGRRGRGARFIVGP